MAVRCLSTVILTPFTLHIFETTHLDDTHPLPCSRSFDLKIVTASTATFKELPWQMKTSLSKKKSRPLQRQTAAELVQSLPNPLIILKNNHNFGGLKVYIASPDNQKWFFFFFLILPLVFLSQYLLHRVCKSHIDAEFGQICVTSFVLFYHHSKSFRFF